VALALARQVVDSMEGRRCLRGLDPEDAVQEAATAILRSADTHPAWRWNTAVLAIKQAARRERERPGGVTGLSQKNRNKAGLLAFAEANGLAPDDPATLETYRAHLAQVRKSPGKLGALATDTPDVVVVPDDGSGPLSHAAVAGFEDAVCEREARRARLERALSAVSPDQRKALEAWGRQEHPGWGELALSLGVPRWRARELVESALVFLGVGPAPFVGLRGAPRWERFGDLAA
jgi:DNA-directed RNA polymerase specialized sigma24 family protein